MVSSIFSIDVSLRNSDLSHGSNYNPQLKTAEPISPAQFFHSCIRLYSSLPSKHLYPDISHKSKSVVFLTMSLSPNNAFSSYVLCITSTHQTNPETSANLCSFLFLILPFIQVSLLSIGLNLFLIILFFSPCSHPTLEEYLIFRLY